MQQAVTEICYFGWCYCHAEWENADLCLVLVRYKKKKKKRGKGIYLNTQQWVVNKRLSRINKLIKLMSVDEREKKYQPEASTKQQCGINQCETRKNGIGRMD